MIATPPKRTQVFVYGTLKRGGAWHHLLKHAEYLGTAVTAHRYPMVIEGIPYLLDQPFGRAIHGEVYAADYETMRALDALEQHPNWYNRRLKEVVLNGERAQAYIYFLHENCYDQLGENEGWRRATHHSVFPV